MSNELTKKQIEFLNKCTETSLINKHKGGTWTYDPITGLVDVDGSFYCDGYRIKIHDFNGVRFGKVGGTFCCNSNLLTSLEGAPQEVGGSFICYSNKLTSLKGAPQKVGWNFSCHDNKLTTLEGAPQEVGGDFNCRCNKLTSLEGAPQYVAGDFYCDKNRLTSLEGAPQEVGGDFDCSGNNLTSFKPLPRKVGGGFKSDHIKIKKYGIVETLKAKEVAELRLKQAELRLKKINDFIYNMCGEGNEEEIKLYLDLYDIGL